MVTVQQQWPGRGRRSNEYVPAAPVVVEKELPRVPEEMVYQARGQQARLEPDRTMDFLLQFSFFLRLVIPARICSQTCLDYFFRRLFFYGKNSRLIGSILV